MGKKGKQYAEREFESAELARDIQLGKRYKRKEEKLNSYTILSFHLIGAPATQSPRGPPGQVNDGFAARGILHQFDPEGNPFLKGFSLAIMKLGCPP